MPFQGPLFRAVLLDSVSSALPLTIRLVPIKFWWQTVSLLSLDKCCFGDMIGAGNLHTDSKTQCAVCCTVGKGIAKVKPNQNISCHCHPQ